MEDIDDGKKIYKDTIKMIKEDVKN